MKKIDDYSDAEKIRMFEKLYSTAENAFTELCIPDNCDYFDTHAELEGFISDVLDLEQEDWDAKIAELNKKPNTFQI